jgi:hypothetical protein
MSVNVVDTTELHVKLKDDLAGIVHKYVNAHSMPMIDALAITSQFLGMLVALQDQTKWTPEALMSTVSINLQIGNSAVIENIGSFNTHGQPKGKSS